MGPHSLAGAAAARQPSIRLKATNSSPLVRRLDGFLSSSPPSVVLQEHRQPLVNQPHHRRLLRRRQSRDLPGARAGPAHPVLQPQGEPGHPPDQSGRHSLHATAPQVGPGRRSPWPVPASQTLSHASVVFVPQASRLLVGRFQRLGFHDHPLLG